MKKILTSLILLISMNAIAQSKAYDVTKDTKGEGLIYNGVITFDNLNKESSFTWLRNGYEEYKPDAEKTSYLNNNLKNFSMVVFLGTWCDDSHELVPKLEKVLTRTDFPQSKLTMYGVDREKKTRNGADKKYGITLVPTIILFNSEGKEVGRITESVNKSIEADLANIIKK